MWDSWRFRTPTYRTSACPIGITQYSSMLDSMLHDSMRSASLSRPGRVVWPSKTTRETPTTACVKGYKQLVRPPTRYRHGLERSTQHFVEETKVTVHGTTRPDGCTYYTCFALDGVVYLHDEEVLIGCDDGDSTKCKITSLWEERKTPRATTWSSCEAASR